MSGYAWLVGFVIALLGGILVAECALRIASLGRPQ